MVSSQHLFLSRYEERRRGGRWKDRWKVEKEGEEDGRRRGKERKKKERTTDENFLFLRSGGCRVAVYDSTHDALVPIRVRPLTSLSNPKLTKLDGQCVYDS